jgi:molybdenum cofactor cytidylyltransferase
MIPLRKALRLDGAPQIAVVGGGGKTTAMFALASQFSDPVLVTTSTHLALSQTALGDLHIDLRNESDIHSIDVAKLPAVTVVTGPEQTDDRVSGPPPEVLGALSAFARQHSLPLLIEADGARLRALKAPAEHEPAIPDFVDAVVVVAGLSAIGKPLTEEWVHRPEQFAELSGLQIGDEITTDSLTSVLLHKDGGLKNIPRRARRIVLLNQADSPELEATARGLARTLLSGYDAVWVGALRQSTELSAVYEPVAGIVLAAGESKRLGQPKALLDWKGKPFVRQVAETALSAGLKPVVVVTGANAEQVEAALAGLDVQIMRNFIWYEGQSTSVRAGLKALPRTSGSALFMVVDQPQLPVTLIEALVAAHASSLAPITAPMVDDHRTNPALFDRSTFADFAGLEGDVGGRAIFSRHKVSWLPWLDSSLAIDVDTPEDYSRLLSQTG